jgi:hypothetical protein
MSEQELSTKDRALINLTVHRLDFKLDGRVPWRRRRQIRNELRANLIEATREVGVFAAVQRLGDLDELAKSYLELYRGRFDFQVGAYCAVITYAVIQIIGIAVILAFHAGVASTGAHSGTYSFRFWNGFGPYAGSVTGDTGFSMTIVSPAHAILMLAAFAIGSSYGWLFRRHRSDKPSSMDRFLSRHAGD